MKGKNKNIEKGITLIALVITIIVLLILAGISITTLTGDNGILTKVGDAKTQNEKASIKEQIDLAVLTSRMNDSNDASIDTDILDEELRTQINGIDIEKQSDGSLPWTVTVNGYKFQIKEDGTVEIVNGIILSRTILEMAEGQEELITATVTEGITGTVTWSSSNTNVATVNNGTIKAVGATGTADITASVSGTDYSAKCTVTVTAREFTIGEAKNTDKYGYKVTNYNVKTTDMKTDVWRLFYQDSDYTYIITDECIGPYNLSSYYSKYSTGANVSSVGKCLNSKISSLLVETNTNSNIRATAWLTDTKKWAQYKNNDAEYAIGSPTVELFAASYNNRSNKSNTISLGVGTYGYTGNTGSNWLKTNDNYGIYNKDCKQWWLSSPYNTNSSRRGKCER